MRVMTKNQKGQALLATIVGISLVLLMLLTTLTITQYSGKLLARQLTYQGQALNAAQAGLTEGRSWFVRQSVQPVVNFAPLFDQAAIPPIDDTEQASVGVGLVRNYLISAPGRVWGRYELDRTGATPATNSIDITTRRGKKGAGLIWQLESQGTVYVNNNPAVAYNVLPNQVLAKRTLLCEIQRLGLNLPANAALLVGRSDRVNIVNTDVQIKGGSTNYGMDWVNNPSGGLPTGAGYPSTVSGTGSGYTSGLSTAVNSLSIPSVFGVTQQELLNMADVQSTTNVAAILPTPTSTLPQMSLIVLNSPGTNFTFDSVRPLTGTGILVVFGNLIIAANSNSVFNGLVYVQGTFTMSQPSTINGSVIVVDAAAAPAAGIRTVTLSGAGEKPVLRYDTGILSYVAQRMGQYKTSRNPYIPCSLGVICE
jgi:hypothetical protein